ncbi:hypothetical protein CERSUDRAFT_110848 [Gelatoporia subvermispora B]|uniref:Magnesium transporter n=1 Tax=Ceriporiopsis subvermispora (strain B) TaxID=914234 RepID=M2RD24_CERS8|nr:hypothetical protein CERSUDRAFT_110848 [Gelatoporia subvermispora B]
MASPSSVPQSASTLTSPPQYRSIGVVLAIGSGVLIGTSFVFKKKGLLSSQKGHAAGEGVAYLKSPMWWTGMTIMILGELCNFAAYAFVEAIIVTPMGALSVVISSILSHIFLREKLSLFDWISSAQCLLGASILALNGPQEQSVSTIEGFKHLFLAPGFLVYGALVIASAAILAFWAAPKWGERSMMPYLGVCSLIGGLSVSCTQGLGASIVTSIRGENQFKNWFIYFLLVFVAATLLTEVYYLNVALAKFNTAMVAPTYYVTFTFCTLVTSVILYQGLKASASQIMTIVLAFLVICTGIMILQMSKVDPRTLMNVDEHTTMLLEVAKQEVEPCAAQTLEDRAATFHSRRSRTARLRTMTGRSMAPFSQDEGQAIDIELAEQPDTDTNAAFLSANDAHHIIAKTEEPGLDSLRGTFGAIGTIIRARRRAQAASSASIARSRLSRSSVSPSNRSTSRGRNLPFATSQPAAAGGGLGWIWGWRRRDATMSGHAGGSGFWRGHDEDIIPEGDAEKSEGIVQILPSPANDVDEDGKPRTPPPFRSGLSQSYRQLGSHVQLANHAEDAGVYHRTNAGTMPPSFTSAQRMHVGDIFQDLRRS